MGRSLRLRVAGGAVILASAAAVVWSGNPIGEIFGIAFGFALWYGVTGVVDRSRYVGGVVMAFFSLPFLFIGAVSIRVGALGALAFLYGSWLAIVGAARLDR